MAQGRARLMGLLFDFLFLKEISDFNDMQPLSDFCNIDIFLDCPTSTKNETLSWRFKN